METKKKLVLPVALAVVALASTGCGSTPAPATDAGSDAAIVADSGASDAGCVPPEVYDPVSMACVPLV